MRNDVINLTACHERQTHMHDKLKTILMTALQNRLCLNLNYALSSH